jgi:predicted adenylyl cyclase CyaB
MTFKGPRQPGPFKKREEINVRVGCGSAACALLRNLGCVEIMRFQKRRETWELGACEVALDDVPHLGLFVEIEGPDTESVRRVQGELGLQNARHIPQSYISLLYEYCRGHGLDVETIIFPSEQG